mgnify:CR=1 FL=1
MFPTSLVVRKHAVAVLHVENFVIKSTVITGLTAEVVELLTELSNKLVLLR